jgi:hypothetical protein
MAFYETSAKDKTMVDDAFFALTRDIKKRLGESSGGPSTTRTTGPITVPFAIYRSTKFSVPIPLHFHSVICGCSDRCQMGM